MASATRVVTGIKPTGTPHLGNYLGMMRPALRLAERGEALFFVADGHALTTMHSRSDLARHTAEGAAAARALARPLLARVRDAVGMGSRPP